MGRESSSDLMAESTLGAMTATESKGMVYLSGRDCWVIFRPDGRQYNGDWLNGHQHGEGTFTDRSGISRKGIWSDGKRVRWLE